MSGTATKTPGFDGQIEEIEHQWIPMPDGVRLAARIWRPVTAEATPCPAILEYIPYRKRDMVRPRDARNHPFFAAHGYVCLRVDMRGSGDSEGTMPDMYDPNELDDARHVIDWIAAQPWCSGQVGMFGTSWGGTASLQAAVRAPGPLKAVIANCATIDRFEDDIHWMGGAILTDSLEWAATLPAILAAPPDSATVGADWQAIWQDRLDQIRFPFQHWANHNRRGRYWRHGSVRFQTDDLSCPILAVGGWSDRYSNSVMPLVRARPDLVRGIVGPWGHHYPDHGEPGPGMSFQEVALRWWDHWLKPGGAPLDWPALQVWQRSFDPPQDRLSARSGGWLTVQDPAEVAGRTWHLGAGGLTDDPAPTDRLTVPFDLDHGACAGDTGYFGRVGGLPLDQAPDDARALRLDTAPLSQDVDLLGHAVLELDVTADHLPAQFVARLCDVAPDGRSTLITRTLRMLALDAQLDGPSGAAPGQAQRIALIFPTMAYRLPAGHRLRLALGASYWPLVWPVAHAAPLQVSTQGASLHLPGVPESAQAGADLPEPGDWPPVKQVEVTAQGPLHRFGPAPEGDGTLSGWHQPEVEMRFPDLGVSLGYETRATYRHSGNDPTSVSCEITHRITIARPDGTADTQSRIVMRAAAGGGATCQNDLQVTWNAAPRLHRQHGFDIPPD